MFNTTITRDSYRDYFSYIPWQIYLTFTFPWKVDDVQANKTFCDVIARLERHQRRPVAYLRADEKRLVQPSGCGLPPSGRHFHALLASGATLNSAAIEYYWKCLMGDGAGIDRVGNLTLGGYAKVERYDPSQNGLEYILKCLRNPDEYSELTLSDNLGLFLPEHLRPEFNSRMNRKLRRMTQSLSPLKLTKNR